MVEVEEILVIRLCVAPQVDQDLARIEGRLYLAEVGLDFDANATPTRHIGNDVHHPSRPRDFKAERGCPVLDGQGAGGVELAPAALHRILHLRRVLDVASEHRDQDFVELVDVMRSDS